MLLFILALLKASICFSLDSNTSHVIVYLAHCMPAAFRHIIQIHLMLLFIRYRRNNQGNALQIQIHLMLLFIHSSGSRSCGP